MILIAWLHSQTDGIATAYDTHTQIDPWNITLHHSGTLCTNVTQTTSTHEITTHSRYIVYKLMSSGDVHTNPGPVTSPCPICSKPVRWNQRGIMCDGCDYWHQAYVSCEIPSRRLPRTEPNTIEAIHVELLISEHKWLLMANYRPPPQSPKSYTENATKALDSAFNNFDNVILLGDLNFNMLIKEKSAPLTELCDIFDLTNMVKEPTCFPKNSNPSLLDVILTNKPSTFNGTRICDTGLSDVHRLVACVMKNTVKQKRNGKTTYRSFKNLDETALLRDIENAPLHIADIFDDIDDICWAHEKLLSEVIDEHIPVKERKQRPSKATYTNGRLRKEINYKKKLRRTFENSRTTNNWNNFRIQRN